MAYLPSLSIEQLEAASSLNLPETVTFSTILGVPGDIVMHKARMYIRNCNLYFLGKNSLKQ